MKKIFLITLLILFFSGCQKDWGTTDFDNYESVNGPENKMTVYYRIVMESNKTSLKYGDDCIVEAKVYRIEKFGSDTISISENLSKSVFFAWNVIDITDERQIYFSFWGFKINGNNVCEGMGINQVTVSTPDYYTLSSHIRQRLENADNFRISCLMRSTPADPVSYLKTVSFRLLK